MHVLPRIWVYLGLLGYLFWPGLAACIAWAARLRHALRATEIERRNLRLALLTVLPLVRGRGSVDADVATEERDDGNEPSGDEPADHDPG